MFKVITLSSYIKTFRQDKNPEKLYIEAFASYMEGRDQVHIFLHLSTAQAPIFFPKFVYVFLCELFLAKGCSLVWFSEPAIQGEAALLFQESVNPTVYNKLSCHLPWIAKQYDMDFHAEDTERECVEGVVDPISIQEETRECRTTVSDGFSFFGSVSEAKCIFPFYLEGKYYDGCAMLEHDGFLIRVFFCPIFNTVNKINGTNSYTYSDLVQQVREMICKM